MSRQEARREPSQEREATAWKEIVNENRAIGDSTHEETTVAAQKATKLDPTFTANLKKAVLKIVDSENQLTALRRRIEHLEKQKVENTVRKGLKLKTVKAKATSENASCLQGKFNDIIKEAESKLLEASIANLRVEFATAKKTVRSRESKSTLFWDVGGQR